MQMTTNPTTTNAEESKVKPKKCYILVPVGRIATKTPDVKSSK
jgi:hypothetical protein